MYYYAFIHKDKYSKSENTYAAITSYELLTIEEARSAFNKQYLGQIIVDYYECMTKQSCINLVNNRSNIKGITYILPKRANSTYLQRYKDVTPENLS